MIRSCCLLLALTLAAPLAHAQKHDSSFEIRENTSGVHGWSWQGGNLMDPGDGTWSARNMPLRQLMAHAYGVRTDQITGIPDALRHERFDVKIDPNNAAVDQLHDLASDKYPIPSVQLMLRKMLVEKFGLKIHVEQQERSVYELVPTAGGARLKQNLTCALGVRTLTGLHPCGEYNLDEGRIVGAAANMDTFARFLGGYAETVVLNKTALKSTYDVNIMWREPTGDREDKTRSLSAAMEKQLGLRLQPAVDAVPRLVVDHVELPSNLQLSMAKPDRP